MIFDAGRKWKVTKAKKGRDQVRHLFEKAKFALKLIYQ